MKIAIFDPAMCCSTGVCGPSVDPELVRIQEALRQIQKQAPAVVIERYSLSNDPQAYVDNAVVAERLKDEGPQSLPIVLVDGRCVSKQGYPKNDQLAALLKDAGHNVSLDAAKPAASSCCGSGCC
jgi:hypothetical protein